MAKKPEYEVEDWQTAYHNAKTPEEAEQAMRDYNAAKLRNAERREQYMLECALERSERRKAKFTKATASLKSTLRWLINKFFQKAK